MEGTLTLQRGLTESLPEHPQTEQSSSKEREGDWFGDGYPTILAVLNGG